jgi:hypothetical protein
MHEREKPMEYSSGAPGPSRFAMLAFVTLLAVILIKSGFSAIRNHSIMLWTGRFSMGPGKTLEGNLAALVGAVLLGLGIALLGLAVAPLLLPD